MQRYIEQLIEDLHQATWGLKPPHPIWEESQADPDNECELDDISYIEEFVEGEEIPVSSITGIDLNLLPPEEQLTDEQKTLLSIKLETLLEYFHFHLEFPESYPHHLRYHYIRKFWTEKQVALSFGTCHIEFCEYDETQCPFPGYCKTCYEVDQQMKHDEQKPGLNDPYNELIMPF